MHSLYTHSGLQSNLEGLSIRVLKQSASGSVRGQGEMLRGAQHGGLGHDKSDMVNRPQPIGARRIKHDKSDKTNQARQDPLTVTDPVTPLYPPL